MCHRCVGVPGRAGNTTVGPESGLTIALFNDAVSLVINDVLLPSVNKVLAAGIPLPSVPGLTFQNSVLALEAGYALIGIDFKLGA